MEKKTIIAIVLCIGVWLIWAQFFQPPLKRKNTAVKQTSSEVKKEVSSPAKTLKEAEPATVEEEPKDRNQEKLVSLRSEKMEAVISSHGARLKNLRLFDFKERDEAKKEDELGYEDLVSTTDELNQPMAIHFNPEKTTFHLPKYQDWEVIQQSNQETVLKFEDRSDSNVPVITKRFIIKEGYQIDLNIEIENRGTNSIEEQVILNLYSKSKPTVKTGCVGAPRVPTNPMCMVGKKIYPASGTCSAGKPMEPGTSKVFSEGVRWTGINEQYFLMAAIPIGVTSSVCDLKSGHNNVLTSSLMYPEETIAPGAKQSHRFRVFAGPKKLKMLEKVNGGENDQNAKLTASVNYGWFSFLCYPMLWLLKNFYALVGNYGIAIIFLTILIKIVLLPLTHKSMKSMGDMAKLKPMMEDLKKRHGDDKQKMNQEMMNLYKSHKINPAGGCFPMLLQMPIWIALYRMLYSSVELYQAPFIPGWLSDLSYRDPYFIMPVVLGLTMFLQQKISPTSADTQQAKMMLYMMPAFFTFIMLYLPSGLVLYIFVNSILSILHQVIYNRMKEKKKAAATAN